MIDNVEIKYNQKQAKIGLAVGLVFLVLGIVSLFYGSRPFYITFAIAAVNISISCYRLSVSYLSVKDGYMMKKFGKKIAITDIIETKRVAGDYSFASETKKIVIDGNAVDKDSIPHIENLINTLRGVKV